MGGTTPKYQLPYPTGTDRVADGDNAIQALAERVEVVVPLVRVGVVGMATNAGSDGTITFATPFPNTLTTIVVTEASNPASLGPLILKYQPTLSNKTGAAMRVYTTTGGTLPNTTVTVAYVAYGT
jgi:hypothetical protein